MEELNYGYKYALLKNIKVIPEYRRIITTVDGINSGECLDFAIVNGKKYNLKIAKIKDPISLFEYHLINLSNDGVIDFTRLFNNFSNARLLEVYHVEEFENHTFDREITFGDFKIPYTVYDFGRYKSILYFDLLDDGIRVKRVNFNDQKKSNEILVCEINNKGKTRIFSDEFKEKENLEKIVEEVFNGLY